MKPTWILLIRHGETDWNKERRMQGQTEVSLNETGVLQAKKIGFQLKKYPIDVLYSSPQIRAYETAKVIHRYHTKIPFHTHDALKERSFGETEGKLFDEIITQYPTLSFDKNWNHPLFQPSGGERIKDVYERSERFLAEVLKKEEGRSIAIVSHGVTIRCMICSLLHLPLPHNIFFEIYNTSLTIIKKPNKGESELHVINNLTHLDHNG